MCTLVKVMYELGASYAPARSMMPAVCAPAAVSWHVGWMTRGDRAKGLHVQQAGTQSARVREEYDKCPPSGDRRGAWETGRPVSLLSPPVSLLSPPVSLLSPPVSLLSPPETPVHALTRPCMPVHAPCITGHHRASPGTSEPPYSQMKVSED